MKEEAAGSGIGFAGLLAVLFIGLKLTRYIDWSWWWVLSPLWIGTAIVLGLGIVFALTLGFIAILAVLWDAFGPRGR